MAFCDLYIVPIYGLIETNSFRNVVCPFSAAHKVYSGESVLTTKAYIPGFRKTGLKNSKFVFVEGSPNEGFSATTISEGYLVTFVSGYQKSLCGVAFTVGLISTETGILSSSLFLK